MKVLSLMTSSSFLSLLLYTVLVAQDGQKTTSNFGTDRCEQFKMKVITPDNETQYKLEVIKPDAGIEYKGIVINPCEAVGIHTADAKINDPKREKPRLLMPKEEIVLEAQPKQREEFQMPALRLNLLKDAVPVKKP